MSGNSETTQTGNIAEDEVIQKPFADYDDHEDCVRQNQDKDDPDAYCASIERKIKEARAKKTSEFRNNKDTGGVKPEILNPAFMILKADSRFIVGGYANVYMIGKDGETIPDRQNETVTLEALDEALQLLMAKESRRNHMYWHSNIQIGELIWEATDSEGTLWKTHVVYEASEQYPKKGLFILSDMFMDAPPSLNAIKQMEKGDLLEFSIGGLPLAKESRCDSEKCWAEITKLYLGEVSSCEQAVNRESKAFILKALGEQGPSRITCDMTPSQLAGIMQRLSEMEKAVKL